MNKMSSSTVKCLKEEAKVLGIKGYSTMKKAELEQAVRAMTMPTQGDFSSVLLSRLEELSRVKTQAQLQKLWTGEVKKVRDKQKQKPELKQNLGYKKWKFKLTRLYQFSATMLKMRDPTTRNKIL